jgi:uncharacterized repeat protein (TIGR01451 family)
VSVDTPLCDAEEGGVSATLGPEQGCRITVRFTRTSAEGSSAELVARKGDNRWSAELVAVDGTKETTTSTNGTTTTTNGTTTTTNGTTTTTNGTTTTTNGTTTTTNGNNGNGNGGNGDSADVVVTYSVSRDTVAAGQTLTYVSTVHNHGPAAAGNVTVSVTLPSEVTLVGVSSSLGGCSTLPCNLGTVNGGSSATVLLEVEVNGSAVAGALLTSTASVGSDVIDPNEANNTSSARTRVQPAIGLIDIDRETIEFGDTPGTEQLVLTNVGVIDVTISGHSMSDPFTAEGCVGTTLSPGESCVITVMFPASGGAWCEVLEVSHNGEGDRRALIKGGI